MRTGDVLLGEYLRARRSICQPEEVGLPRETARRVPGLRRDEVAGLAGISREYYLRLEQGRVGSPSTQVLNALARALRLDGVARNHLFRLALGLGAPGDPASDEVQDAGDRSPATRAMLGRTLAQWSACPAYVTDRHRDIVLSNRLAVALGGRQLAPGGNTVVRVFAPHMKTVVRDWEALAITTLASLRYDADPHSPRLHEIVQTLSDDPQFVRLWSRHDVAAPSEQKIGLDLGGRPVGATTGPSTPTGSPAGAASLTQIEVCAQNLTIPALPGHQLTVLLAEPGSAAQRLFDQLATAAAGAAAAETVAA